MSDTIEREITIAAPIERVWDLITQPEHVGTWTDFLTGILPVAFPPMSVRRCSLARSTMTIYRRSASLY